MRERCGVLEPAIIHKFHPRCNASRERAEKINWNRNERRCWDGTKQAYKVHFGLQYSIFFVISLKKIIDQVQISEVH